jgi:thiamine-phosphate pyrophosphorylase
VKVRGLYAITPETADVMDKVSAALEAGIAMLQYRRKSLPKKERTREARSMAELARARGIPFIVNDDVELALEVGADGVHLGRDDGDPTAARAKLGGLILGVSCYDRLGLAREAVAAGADYVAFGSVFASATKPAAVRAPLSLFSEARSLGVPLCAIGGITLDNARQVADAGADLLAVISDLFDADDVGARARQYAKVLS